MLKQSWNLSVHNNMGHFENCSVGGENLSVWNKTHSEFFKCRFLPTVFHYQNNTETIHLNSPRCDSLLVKHAGKSK